MFWLLLFRWISCKMWLRFVIEIGCEVDHKALAYLKIKSTISYGCAYSTSNSYNIGNVLFRLVNLWSLFSYMINHFILGLSHLNSPEPLFSINSTISANCSMLIGLWKVRPNKFSWGIQLLTLVSWVHQINKLYSFFSHESFICYLI